MPQTGVQMNKQTYKDLEGLPQRDHNDCSVIAVCVLTGESYDVVYNLFKTQANRRDGGGASIGQVGGVLKTLGYELGERSIVPEHEFLPKLNTKAKSVRVNHMKAQPEVFPTTMLCHFDNHYAAWVDGKIEDWIGDTNSRLYIAYEVIKTTQRNR